jgi:prolyl-tRNA editing enzyme YbaK/EbsC (Cys-tRNA(Pro) deacylase)
MPEGSEPTATGPAIAEPFPDRLLTFLTNHEADFRVLHHEPVRTSAEAATVRGTAPEQGAKALVFQADDRLVLLVLQGHLRVDTPAFKRAAGIKNLRMIAADDLHQRFGLEVGAVPPFGHLLGLPTHVDEQLLAVPRIAFNAGSRTTSVVLATTDFVRLEQPTVGRFVVDGATPHPT